MARVRPSRPSDPVVIKSDDTGLPTSNTGRPVGGGSLRTPVGYVDNTPIPARQRGWRQWRNLAWQATTTVPGVGNGSLQGWYKIDGLWLECWIEVTMGSTTTYGTGSWYFNGRPAPTVTPLSPLATVGWCGMRDDSGPGNYSGPVGVGTDGSITPRVPNYGGSNGAVSNLNSATPFTWASGDSLNLYAKYRYRD